MRAAGGGFKKDRVPRSAIDIVALRCLAGHGGSTNGCNVTPACCALIIYKGRKRHKRYALAVFPTGTKAWGQKVGVTLPIRSVTRLVLPGDSVIYVQNGFQQVRFTSAKARFSPHAAVVVLTSTVKNASCFDTLRVLIEPSKKAQSPRTGRKRYASEVLREQKGRSRRGGWA